MRVDIPTKSLSAVVRLVKPAYDRRSALPVLSNAKVSAADGRLTLLVTDLDLTIEASVPADVHEPGVALANVIELGKTGKGDVRLEEVDGGIRAVNGITRLLPKMGTLDDFPMLAGPGTEADAVVTVDVDALASVIDAASSDQNRPVLTSVLFTAVDGQPEIVATDSYRLHIVRPPAVGDWSALADKPMLLPARAVRAVLAAVKTGQVTITRRPNPGHEAAVVITCDLSVVWSTRELGAEFPNYRMLVPSSHPYRLTFARPAFDDAVHSIGGLSGYDPIRVAPHDNGVELWVPDGNGGRAGEVVLPGSMTGPMFATNPTYLADLIAGTTTCSIEYVDSLKPVLVHDRCPFGEVVRILMPVRTA